VTDSIHTTGADQTQACTCPACTLNDDIEAAIDSFMASVEPTATIDQVGNMVGATLVKALVRTIVAYANSTSDPPSSYILSMCRTLVGVHDEFQNAVSLVSAPGMTPPDGIVGSEATQH
jgi:uncharacterized YccA/Bax inhibitor family protein